MQQIKHGPGDDYDHAADIPQPDINTAVATLAGQRDACDKGMDMHELRTALILNEALVMNHLTSDLEIIRMIFKHRDEAPSAFAEIYKTLEKVWK